MEMRKCYRYTLEDATIVFSPQQPENQLHEITYAINASPYKLLRKNGEIIRSVITTDPEGWEEIDDEEGIPLLQTKAVSTKENYRNTLQTLMEENLELQKHLQEKQIQLNKQAEQLNQIMGDLEGEDWHAEEMIKEYIFETQQAQRRKGE